MAEVMRLGRLVRRRLKGAQQPFTVVVGDGSAAADIGNAASAEFPEGSGLVRYHGRGPSLN
jgi:hypothetical protein